MGSCGSWDASLSLQKKVDISQKEENSLESIKKFISKNIDSLYESKGIKKITKDDILLSIILEDEDEDFFETILLSDLGLENINAKEFIENKVYDNHDEFDEGISVDNWIFNVKIKDLETKLKFLNLTILKDNLGGWNVNNTTIISETGLASCSGYIYCNNDNSGSDSYKITQKFIDSLNVGDKLVLNGNGDGEHC